MSPNNNSLGIYCDVANFWFQENVMNYITISCHWIDVNWTCCCFLSINWFLVSFVAVDKLGLPYLNACLDALLPNFRHGASFAAGGSTIQPVDAKLFGAGFNPLSLNIQLLQFEQLKERVNEFYNQG